MGVFRICGTTLLLIVNRVERGFGKKGAFVFAVLNATGMDVFWAGIFEALPNIAAGFLMGKVGRIFVRNESED